RADVFAQLQIRMCANVQAVRRGLHAIATRPSLPSFVGGTEITPATTLESSVRGLHFARACNPTRCVAAKPSGPDRMPLSLRFGSGNLFVHDDHAILLTRSLNADMPVQDIRQH